MYIASSIIVSNIACTVDNLCFCEDIYILDNDTPSSHFVVVMILGFTYRHTL